MKKLRNFLKCFIFADLGGFVGRSLFIYRKYKTDPGFYGIQSAPWYTEIIAMAVVTGIVILIAFIFWLILGYIMKKNV